MERADSNNISRRQLVLRATLSESDHAEVRRCRRGHNRLGFAYQLGFVKLLGRFPRQEALEIFPQLVTFMAIQVGEDEASLGEYQRRRQTVAEHQDRIRAHAGLRRLDDSGIAELEDFVFETACQLEHAADLQTRAREFLRERKILLPADYKLTRIVGEHRERARRRIFTKLADAIPEGLAHTLDDLLEVDGSTSPLQKIKDNPGKESASSMLVLLDKLAVIESTGALNVDVSWLSRNYQRALFHHARKASAKRLRELARPRRHATLACFLWQSYGDAVDQAVDMFDKILTRTSARVQRRLDERMVKHRHLVRSSMDTLQKLGSTILDDSIDDADLRSRLFEQVSREELAGYVRDVEEWVSGRSSDPFVGFVESHSTLRKFTPTLLKALQFSSSGSTPNSCLDAVAMLLAHNETARRKLPENVPIDFVPKRLRRFVIVDGTVDKRAWECALLLRLRDEIRDGNVSVRRSKRFAPLDDFFMPPERWEAERERFFARARLPSDPQQVPGFLSHRLGKAFEGFLAAAPDNGYATVDDDKWHLSTDSGVRPDGERLAQLKKWLAHRCRRIELTDLLIEVNNDLQFTRHFFTPGPRGEASADDVCTTLLAVLAHGCNLGPHKMSELTRGVTYKQLKRVSDWQLTPEAQRAALATLTQGIASLDATAHWGDGRTSASDGQRFALPRKVLQQTYSTTFSDFALEFYTFVADNYAPFYSRPIECTDRDAAFVLDGLLYNESELELEEHYTDTHGYTEINFAAFAMLGRRFCPRIKGVQHQRIYRIDRGRDYGALGGLVDRADRTIDTRVIVEQWDRLGHLFASLESGCSSASVVLKRLVGYTGKNKIYRASRDLGRIFKTEFILDYMSTPDLRTRVRRYDQKLWIGDRVDGVKKAA